MYKKKLFLILYLSILGACSTLNEKIQDLEIRSTKIHINKKLGPTFMIKRKYGYDYWIYKIVIDGKHYTRTLILKNGYLYKKDKLKPYSLKTF